MKYLCLAYIDEQRAAALTPEQNRACVNDSLAYDNALRASGHLIAAHALEPVTMATTLRHHDGGISATDGPFAETKEHLGGFLLIEARDLDEAIQLASKVPVGKLGCIEVRPVTEIG